MKHSLCLVGVPFSKFWVNRPHHLQVNLKLYLTFVVDMPSQTRAPTKLRDIDMKTSLIVVFYHIRTIFFTFRMVCSWISLERFFCPNGIKILACFNRPLESEVETKTEKNKNNKMNFLISCENSEEND